MQNELYLIPRLLSGLGVWFLRILAYVLDNGGEQTSIAPPSGYVLKRPVLRGNKSPVLASRNSTIQHTNKSFLLIIRTEQIFTLASTVGYTGLPSI